MAHANRIESIDTLRGVDLFMLAVGAVLIVSGARVMAPDDTAQVIVHQLTHANWGATLTCWDMVMPLFIFIVGASMPFAFAKYRERGGERWYWGTSWRVARRVARGAAFCAGDAGARQSLLSAGGQDAFILQHAASNSRRLPDRRGGTDGRRRVARAGGYSSSLPGALLGVAPLGAVCRATRGPFPAGQ